MKLFNKLTLVILAVASFEVTCQAQRGFDMFAVPRTVVLAGPQDINTIGTAPVTNGPVSTPIFDGIASIDLFAYTNTGTSGGTMTATLYGSNDKTNFTAITGYALISSTTAITYTNYQYGNAQPSTNNYLLPGTIVVPTAATAGFAIPYLNPLPFTNTGPVTISAGGYQKVGLSINDYARYLYVVWTPGGTATNFTVGATMTASITQ